MLRTPILISCIFTLLSFAPTTHAQLSVGAGIGGQSSYFLIDQIPSAVGEATSRAMTGVQAGMSVRYQFSPKLSLRSGMGYQYHRINWRIQPFWLGLGQVYRLHYISIPLVAQLTPTERWHIIAGMEAGCLLIPASKAEQWQRFDYGLRLGAGFAIIPPLHLNFEYFIGLPRVGEGRFLDEEQNINGVYYFRNRSVRVSAIYYFWEFN